MPIESIKNQPNNPWFFKIYKGEVKAIPFVVKNGPRAEDLADITNYTFRVRGRISMDTDEADFDLDNTNFEILDPTKGLACFSIPQNVLDGLVSGGQYLCQIAVTGGDSTIMSSIFTLKVLQSV